MTDGNEHRTAAFRVAGIATVIVMAGYMVAALVLNLVVTHHVVTTMDNRLADRLNDVRSQTLALPRAGAASGTDLDDAPTFLWSISPSGQVTALTPGAPALPARTWGTSPVTLAVGSSTLRFDSLRESGTVLVAGESLSNASNIRTTLYLAELVFGVILAVAVFTGATIVGLRASAPSELVRRRQAEFTADASHELRTPISVIEAEVQLALDRERTAQDYRSVLERIGAEGRRLRAIVEDLLWLARADDRPVTEGELEVTDVVEVVRSCAQRFAAVAAAQSVDLDVKCDDAGPCTIEADAELVDRLAGALIDNACKFAGEGGRVTVSVGATGGRVELRVDDSGPGIPEDQRDAVFDRFHRASDTTAGTGLGLAIADAAVHSTQGNWEIGVSELGGAHMAVSWRRTPHRRGRPATPDAGLTRSLS